MWYILPTLDTEKEQKTEKTEKNSPWQESKKFAIEVIKVLVISLAIIVPIRTFVAQPFFVHGASMDPSYKDGEYLVIDELSYRFREPQRGEVIVFKYPHDEKQFYIKRIIGLPGEELQIERGEIKIFNSEFPRGFVLDEPYLEGDTYTAGTLSVRLGSDEYYVLGDNRLKSSDSRTWGTLPAENIVGRSMFRAWPIDRMTIFNESHYYGSV